MEPDVEPDVAGDRGPLTRWRARREDLREALAELRRFLTGQPAVSEEWRGFHRRLVFFGVPIVIIELTLLLLAGG